MFGKTIIKTILVTIIPLMKSLFSFLFKIEKQKHLKVVFIFLFLKHISSYSFKKPYYKSNYQNKVFVFKDIKQKIVFKNSNQMDPLILIEGDTICSHASWDLRKSNYYRINIILSSDMQVLSRRLYIPAKLAPDAK